jgi:anthranilate synthase component 2
MDNERPKILIVDNYDSFTYNLVQIILEHGGCDFIVLKNDEVNIHYAAIYDGFLFSPGPGIPAEVTIMSELLRVYYCRKSILGICLGHQAIAETFGMKLVKLDTVRHGIETVIKIIDPSDYIFKSMPSEFKAGLYHSWAVSVDHKIPESVSNLRVTALSNDGIIMAIAHVKYDIKGVQFHPESYISKCNHIIIHNWINHLSFGKK